MHFYNSFNIGLYELIADTDLDFFITSTVPLCKHGDDAEYCYMIYMYMNQGCLDSRKTIIAPIAAGHIIKLGFPTHGGYIRIYFLCIHRSVDQIFMDAFFVQIWQVHLIICRWIYLEVKWKHLIGEIIICTLYIHMYVCLP